MLGKELIRRNFYLWSGTGYHQCGLQYNYVVIMYQFKINCTYSGSYFSLCWNQFHDNRSRGLATFERNIDWQIFLFSATKPQPFNRCSWLVSWNINCNERIFKLKRNLEINPLQISKIPDFDKLTLNNLRESSFTSI